MYEATASLNALEELGSLDKKGKPVKTRLKDVKSALNIFENLRRADEGSSVNRARIDAMFDGANPYNQNALSSSGQGLKTNLNFGEAQRLLDISLSAYVDLYSSLEKLEIGFPKYALLIFLRFFLLLSFLTVETVFSIFSSALLYKVSSNFSSASGFFQIGLAIISSFFIPSSIISKVGLMSLESGALITSLFLRGRFSFNRIIS